MIDYQIAADNAIQGDQLVAEILAAHAIDVREKYGFIPPRTLRVEGFDAVDLSAVIAAHVPDPLWAATPAEATARAEGKTLRDDLAALETKARSVWKGESTFTPAQIQKILSGLALRAIRNL